MEKKPVYGGRVLLDPKPGQLKSLSNKYNLKKTATGWKFKSTHRRIEKTIDAGSPTEVGRPDSISMPFSDYLEYPQAAEDLMNFYNFCQEFDTVTMEEWMHNQMGN